MDPERGESYGERGLSPVDRLGVWLSMRAIKRHLPEGPLDLLDLGCGYEARALRMLGERVRTGMGIDLSIAPEAQAVPNLRFAVTTIEEALPQIPDQSQDAVLAISVIEHLWDPQTALAAAHRVLRPGGVLLVNVPTWLGRHALELSGFRLGWSPAEGVDDHKNYYGVRDLWPLLVRAGFKPSTIRLRRHKLGLNLFAVARRSRS
jgi:SAM-dependent methyltransferase